MFFAVKLDSLFASIKIAQHFCWTLLDKEGLVWNANNYKTISTAVIQSRDVAFPVSKVTTIFLREYNSTRPQNDKESEGQRRHNNANSSEDDTSIRAISIRSSSHHSIDYIGFDT